MSSSRVEMTHVPLPYEANLLGTVHGGVIMRLVDEAGGVAAVRHAKRPCVTAAVDSMTFLAPAKVGSLLILKASVNFVGTTSLESGVRVEMEDLLTGQRSHISSAYIVYVALGDDGKPCGLPPLIPETNEDRRRMAEAARRKENRQRVRASRYGGG
ncbi:MAG: acyl-CoA thioesterase, partial [Candidatus Methylomirabilaceae bacterium]